MKTSRSARPEGARMRVLLCLVWAMLLAWLPVVHHHPMPASAASPGPSDQSCTLCVVLAGMDLDGYTPSLGAPPLLSSLIVRSTGLPVSQAADTPVDGRAPPTRSI